MNPDSEIDSLPLAPAPAPVRPPPSWLLPAAALVIGATLLGSALSPYLAVQHPLALLALNPLPRHLILVAPYTEFLPFLLVACTRGLFACWIAYELGRHYGAGEDSAFARRFPNGARQMHALNKLFGRASPLLLLFMPGFLTSGLAGMINLRRWLSLALSLLGLIGWASVNHRLGGYFKPYIEPIMKFFSENMLTATLLCSALVLFFHLRRRRKA